MRYSKSQNKHAKLRALERYHVELSNIDLVQMTLLIQKNCSQVVTTQSHSRVVHKIVYQGIEFIVVYHKKTKQISTFLPPNEEVRPY